MKIAGWFKDPEFGPIHAEVYLESPISDPLLVLEGSLD
jgi:hypothetical protein